MQILNNLNLILDELRDCLEEITPTEVHSFENHILGANSNSKIVGIGAGRVGMAVKSFMMRLGHLGFNAWFIGDSTVPAIGSNDILIVASGSGETKTIVELVKRAKLNNAKILYVGGERLSTIGLLADDIVKIKIPSATSEPEHSIQPMTTLNEQFLGLFFDAVVLDLMNGMRENHFGMWSRHSNLE